MSLHTDTPHTGDLLGAYLSPVGAAAGWEHEGTVPEGTDGRGLALPTEL